MIFWIRKLIKILVSLTLYTEGHVFFCSPLLALPNIKSNFKSSTMKPFYNSTGFLSRYNMTLFCWLNSKISVLFVWRYKNGPHTLLCVLNNVSDRLSSDVVFLAFNTLFSPKRIKIVPTFFQQTISHNLSDHTITKITNTLSCSVGNVDIRLNFSFCWNCAVSVLIWWRFEFSVFCVGVDVFGCVAKSKLPRSDICNGNL